MVREWRQRCSKPDEAAEYVYPLLIDDGGANWAMKTLRNRIRKLFYYEREERQGGRHFPFEESKEDHHYEDCEACQAGRCPRPRNTNPRDTQHRRNGRMGNNLNNLQNIKWVLLDEHDHPFLLN